MSLLSIALVITLKLIHNTSTSSPETLLLSHGLKVQFNRIMKCRKQPARGVLLGLNHSPEQSTEGPGPFPTSTAND